MHEDKLNHDERIRLECLAQANLIAHGQPFEHILQKAAAFEKFVRSGEK